MDIGLNQGADACYNPWAPRPSPRRQDGPSKIPTMILVTGATGFIGRVLVRHLVDAGHEVRILLRPSPRTPPLPKGMSLDVALTGLHDPRGLRAAMVGVNVVYHLAGAEWRGAYANLQESDIQGTQAVAEAAGDAGVERFFYLSHLSADRASAYPVLKAKAIAEEHVRTAGVDYTILRSALVYGPADAFTTGLARLLQALPFVFLVPGDGNTLIQPVWVDDLVTCLVWSLEDDQTRNQIYEVGGPEYLRFNEVVHLIMDTLGIQRTLWSVRPPYLRALTVLLEHVIPALPVSVFWLDYLATHRTCSLDTIPRVFGLMPSRFSHRLSYLEGKNWRRAFWRSLLQRRRPA